MMEGGKSFTSKGVWFIGHKSQINESKTSSKKKKIPYKSLEKLCTTLLFLIQKNLVLGK